MTMFVEMLNLLSQTSPVPISDIRPCFGHWVFYGVRTKRPNNRNRARL